eukprot:jgi/Tetstr1/458849/TSEL_004358.t1
MGVGEDPVGEDGMDIDSPTWPPAGVEAADEGVIREGDPGDFYMKVIAKKFRGVWHYGVITGVVTECVLEDYGGATQWRAVFEDGDIVDLLRSEGYMASEDAGPGAVETPIRLVGSASAAWEEAVDFKDHLEKLLDDVRRTMLKQVPDADPPPYTTEELESEEELPRNLLAEREDAKYTTMVARAQHIYLATPPLPPGADSDDSLASARPIWAALCTVWTPERAHTAVGLDVWRVPGGGGGSGGEEALILLDAPSHRYRRRHPTPAALTTNRHVSFVRRFIRVGAPQRYGATRELRSVRSGRFGHQPAASEFCRKCGKSTTVDGLPVVREEALVSAVTEAMYDRMNGHGHHMELPTGYSVGPSDPKAWPFLTAFDDPKVYAMRELHALCEAHFMHPMDDSDALRDVMG